MDNLVLIRVAADLDAALRRAALDEIGGEGLHRYRITFRTERSRATVAVSLRPELPWIGQPILPRRAAFRRSDPFVARCREMFKGSLIDSVSKPGPDRTILLKFTDGHALVAELATHGANLVLLDPDDRVLGAARSPRAARDRLRVGEVYRGRPLPRGTLSPFGCDPASIDGVLQASVAGGESLLESIRRRLFGIGTVAASQIVSEAAESGLSPGTILSERLTALQAGRLDPVVTGSDDPMELARGGRTAAAGLRLRPWATESGDAGIRRQDAAGTAGLYHEAVEWADDVSKRVAALRSVLDRAVERLWEAETKAAADLRAFEDPDRYRLWAEAVLAGMTTAERAAEHVRVPDPYDSNGAWLVVPAPGGLPLAKVAERHFRAHRRARRGEQAARRRIADVGSRRQRLERLRAENESEGPDQAERLEAGMRAEGIPVGLARRAKGRGPETAVRLEGVRMFASDDGEPILVGRSAKGNDRLTFKIATPDDFWLHAQGRPGAHVVVRNPGRRPRPTDPTLKQAAVLAAWFSEARDETGVEVQWTRRKNVRRARGAPPGTVTLKRFETIRVRPRPPRRS